jgi:iron complex outermembrane recepter protein
MKSATVDFVSEELLAYELGYRAGLSKKLAVDLALFNNEYDKLRVVVPGSVAPGAVAGTFELPLRFSNRMQGRAYGLELAATWQPVDRWRLYGAYSYLKMHWHVRTRCAPELAAAASHHAEVAIPVRADLLLQPML